MLTIDNRTHKTTKNFYVSLEINIKYTMKKKGPTKKPKSKEVEPMLNKKTNLGKFIDTAGTILGGPAMWAMKGVKHIKKLRKESGMDPKKRGGHLSQYD
jgi:hypothetical protein